MSYENFPIKSDFRDKVLEDIAKLALKGGKLITGDVEIEVTLEETE